MVLGAPGGRILPGFSHSSLLTPLGLWRCMLRTLPWRTAVPLGWFVFFFFFKGPWRFFYKDLSWEVEWFYQVLLDLFGWSGIFQCFVLEGSVVGVLFLFMFFLFFCCGVCLRRCRLRLDCFIFAFPSRGCANFSRGLGCQSWGSLNETGQKRNNEIYS